MLELREEQQKVADYRQGYLAVPAVPGAGKTTTLAMLAANLIKEGHSKPGKILIVTCMNSAVANFKSRIAKFLKEYGLPPAQGYEVKTLHSLAVKIIRQSPEALQINEDFTILDEFSQKELIQQQAAIWIANNQKTFYSVLKREGDSQGRLKDNEQKWQKKFLEMLSDLIKYLKASRLSIAYLKELCAEETVLKWVVEIYANYQNQLYLQGMLDFDDLIVRAVDSLKNDYNLRNNLQQQWTYIFEDEAQDSNPLQEEMLFLLADQKKNLVRVGDLNQAILSTFTSSDPKLFQRYCQKEDTKVLPITCSSRSAQPIIDLANRLVLWSRQEQQEIACRNALEEQLIQPAPAGDKFPNPPAENSFIIPKYFTSREAEKKRVIQSALAYLENNPEKTVAILGTNNKFLTEIAEELVPLAVDFYELTKYPRERKRAMNILGEIIDYLAHPHQIRKFLAVLVKLEFLVEEESKNFFAFLTKVGLENILYPLGQEIQKETVPPELTNGDLWERFTRGIEQIRLFFSLQRVEPELLILYLAEQLNFSEEDLAIAQKIALEVRQMMNLHPQWGLAQLAEELKSVDNSFNHFANLVYERKGYEPKPGQLNLATYHKAKGLEWDMVYLTNIVPDDFPSESKNYHRGEVKYLLEEYSNPAEIAQVRLDYLLQKRESLERESLKYELIGEKIRLLYVGITRAKESLFLSGHKINQWNKEMPVSAYLSMIKRYLEEKNNER